MPTREELEEVEKMQKEMQARFRSVPPSGERVEYLGKEFIVYPGVFWPFEDSRPLVENYVVRPGEAFLDVCTGSGVIAVFSALKGAGKVVALDVNPDAVRAARENARLHDVDVDARVSDMFSSLGEERFDAVTANLPFWDREAKDLVEGAMWDPGFRVNRKFFAGVGRFLKPGGRVYVSQANFGSSAWKGLAGKAGFSVRLIGRKGMPEGDPRVFYAFELLLDG